MSQFVTNNSHKNVITTRIIFTQAHKPTSPPTSLRIQRNSTQLNLRALQHLEIYRLYNLMKL